MTWAPPTSRTRQKTGAWTRRKLRRKRLAAEQARGIHRDKRRRDPFERTPRPSVHDHGRV